MTNIIPPRIEKFRKDIAAVIPCWPDEPGVRRELEALPLDKLLRIYLNWTRRHIPPRPRKITFVPTFGVRLARKNGAMT
jgi:hypothetical protein